MQTSRNQTLEHYVDDIIELPVSGETASAATDEALPEGSQDASELPEGEEKPEEKPQKSPEQREIDRLRKSTARLTRQREEARAQLAFSRQEPRNAPAQDDETVSLSRSEFEAEVTKRAQQLAPALQSEQAEIKHRQGVVESLAKSLGQERFDELASDLDEVFGGLADSKGRAKPATDAIFYADDPKALIEYLADPENEEEAEFIARLGPIQAGKAIAKLEMKLDAVKKDAKPKASNAAKPLESVRGGAPKGMPDPVKNEKAWRAWRNAEERAGR